MLLEYLWPKSSSSPTTPSITDWPVETILLVLAVGATLAAVIFIFGYLVLTSPAVRDRLGGLRRALGRVFRRRKGGDEPAGSDPSQEDEDISSSNLDGVKRHFKKVESRLDWCETQIKMLSRNGGGDDRGAGGAKLNESDVRRLVYNLIRENPQEIKRLLGMSGGGGRPQHEPEVTGREAHAARQSQAHAGGDDRRGATASHHGHSGGVTPARAYLELCRLYNAGLNDQIARSEFKSKYAPITISVVNAVERRRDETLPPEFQTASEGNFLAVRLDSAGQYAVFPRFNLILAAVSYGSGAIGEVFKCPGFDQHSKYQNIKVEAPAIFVARGGDSWQKETDGILTLGEPQKD